MESHFEEKQTFFRGVAKIRFNYLTFEDGSVEGGRYLDESNVHRLVDIFTIEGCRPLEPGNRIPALVKQDVLEEAMVLSNISPEELLRYQDPPPELRFPTNGALRCLFGKHRIKAAAYYISNPKDKWWVVELYQDSLPEALVIGMRLENPNDRPISSGEILRNVRTYQLQGKTKIASRWLAQLSRKMRGDVQTLTRLWNGRLLEAFDKLLPFSGLWSGFRVGALQRILPMGCYDELVHYLNYIRQSWDIILNNDNNLKRLLDPDTVKCLEGLIPRQSLSDRNKILSLLRAGQLFPMLTDVESRENIVERILNVSGRVPSLYTFTEDTIYLDAPAKALKSIFALPRKRSIREATSMAYNDFLQSSERILVQCSENHFEGVDTSDYPAVDLAYRQLWLFAIRHFPEMTGIAPRRRPREPPLIPDTRKDILPIFATLAYKLGFETTKIMDLRQGVQGREGDEVGLGMPEVPSRGEPKLSVKDRSLETPFRCGKPFTEAFERDRPFLFCTHIYSNTERGIEEYATSFAVTRDIFLSFFGNWGISFFVTESSVLQPAEMPESPPPINSTARGEWDGEDATSETNHTSYSRTSTMQAIEQFSISPSNYSEDARSYGDSGVSSYQGAFALNDADLSELGLEVQRSPNIHRVPSERAQLHTLFQERSGSSLILLYLYESSRFYLLNAESLQFQESISVLAGDHTFFGWTGEGLFYPKIYEYYNFIRNARFIFVQERFEPRGTLARLSRNVKEEIAMLWDVFPHSRATPPAAYILSMAPFESESTRIWHPIWSITMT